MKHVYNDGGRAADGWKGNAGDCVTRALAIAMNVPYAVIYQDMADGMATQRASKHTRRPGVRSALHGVNTRRKWFKDYMATHGWKWTPTMRIGEGCTVHLDPAELPAGRIIVALSKHYSAVIDGVVHDTFDPNDRGVTIYPPGHPNVPKGAKWLENGNGWAYAPKRCVYGYWSKAQ